MKCTQCSSENLVISKLPFDYWGDGGACLSEEIDVYLCLECGHYEMFSMTRVMIYKNAIKCIEDLEKDVPHLKDKIKELEKDDSILKQEIMDTKSKINKFGIDITIRQQQDLQAKIEELRDARSKNAKEISKLQHQIFIIDFSIDAVRNLVEELISGIRVDKLCCSSDGFWKRDDRTGEVIKADDRVGQIFSNIKK